MLKFPRFSARYGVCSSGVHSQPATCVRQARNPPGLPVSPAGGLPASWRKDMRTRERRHHGLYRSEGLVASGSSDVLREARSLSNNEKTLMSANLFNTWYNLPAKICGPESTSWLPDDDGSSLSAQQYGRQTSRNLMSYWLCWEYQAPVMVHREQWV